MKISSITQLSLLVGISLTLFMVENALPSPIPVPGVKLGLANTVTLWSVFHYSKKQSIMVLVTRIFLGSVITGNFFSITFSLSGGLISLLSCIALRTFMPNLPMWQNSTFGGMLHNIGQLIVAILITNTHEMIYYAPILIIAGMACGLATGFISQAVSDRLYILKKGDNK